MGLLCCSVHGTAGTVKGVSLWWGGPCVSRLFSRLSRCLSLLCVQTISFAPRPPRKPSTVTACGRPSSLQPTPPDVVEGLSRGSPRHGLHLPRSQALVVQWLAVLRGDGPAVCFCSLTVADCSAFSLVGRICSVWFGEAVKSRITPSVILLFLRRLSEIFSELGWKLVCASVGFSVSLICVLCLPRTVEGPLCALRSLRTRTHTGRSPLGRLSQGATDWLAAPSLEAASQRSGCLWGRAGQWELLFTQCSLCPQWPEGLRMGADLWEEHWSHS